MQVNYSAITSRRKEYSVSQSTLAKKAGVSPATISRIENGDNVGFLAVVKVMTELDLRLEDVIIKVTPAASLKILDDLDRIREKSAMYLIDDTLNKLSVTEWRSNRKLSVYYDWHKAIYHFEKKNYDAALDFLESALKRTEGIESLGYLKLELYMAKGNILYLNGQDGHGAYVSAGVQYRVHADRIDYKTGVKLYCNIMTGYCRTNQYDKILDYANAAKSMLMKNESTYLMRKVQELENIAQSNLKTKL